MEFDWDNGYLIEDDGLIDNEARAIPLPTLPMEIPGVELKNDYDGITTEAVE